MMGSGLVITHWPQYSWGTARPPRDPIPRRISSRDKLGAMARVTLSGGDTMKATAESFGVHTATAGRAVRRHGGA